MRDRTFDYVTLRLLVGVVAFAIPLVAYYLARPTALESISASYHTEARDAFVGMLFIVAAFMAAYRGHTPVQGIASKLGALAAGVVAVFPTSTMKLPDLGSGPVHQFAAAVLFIVLTYFCWVFWKATHASDRAVKRRRSGVYAVCGIVMAICIMTIGLAHWWFGEVAKTIRLTFWGEWVALWAFGAAWVIAGKKLPLFSERTERPALLVDLFTLSRSLARKQANASAGKKSED